MSHKPSFPVGGSQKSGSEFRVTLSHAVLLVGLTLGCLFAAFLIGYRSGRGAGFQDASLQSLGNAPRFGIAMDELPQKVPDELASRVYARLQEGIDVTESGKQEAIELRKIPVLDSNGDAVAIEQDNILRQPEEFERSKRQRVVNAGDRNLGDLDIPEKKSREKAVVAISPDTIGKGSASINMKAKGSHVIGEELPQSENRERDIPQQKVIQDKKSVELGSLSPITRSPSSFPRDSNRKGEADGVVMKNVSASPKDIKQEVSEQGSSIGTRTAVKANSTSKTLGGLFELSNESPKSGLSAPRPEVAKSVGGSPSTGQGETSPTSVVNPRVKLDPVVPVRPETGAQGIGVQAPLNVGWYVQVAAPTAEGDARRLVAKLRGSGFRESRVQEATVNGVRYYRVLVGPETNSVLAQRLLGQVAREPYISGKPYLKRVQ
ncbi:MAG: SPOR domain-containing protein [Bdellovibrionales bacterium]|nr:SPOR domain-containing protein [Bdellovibrionales bacterium]